jgi:hypothetical protein
MTKLKVREHDYLYKDTETGAVINTNNSERQACREKILSSKAKENRLEKLENDMNDIKKVLNNILEKLNG